MFRICYSTKWGCKKVDEAQSRARTTAGISTLARVAAGIKKSAGVGAGAAVERRSSILKALSAAISCGKEDEIKLLIVELNTLRVFEKDNILSMGLILAVIKGQTSIVRVLLENGANIFVNSIHGAGFLDPLHESCKLKNNNDILKLLLKHFDEGISQSLVATDEPLACLIQNFLRYKILGGALKASLQFSGTPEIMSRLNSTVAAAHAAAVEARNKAAAAAVAVKVEVKVKNESMLSRAGGSSSSAVGVKD